MEDDIETYDHAGCTIHIRESEMPDEGPREWANVGTILTFHRSGEYGEWTPSDVTGYDEVTAATQAEAIEQVTELLKQHHGATVVIPVWHYTHSGMTIRTGDSNPFSCPWDSGLMGLIFDTPEGVATCYGDHAHTPEDIRKSLEAEVTVFDQWLRGESYGYVIETEEDDHAESCWCYYDLDHCKQEAREAAEHERKRLDTKRAELARLEPVWRH